MHRLHRIETHNPQTVICYRISTFLHLLVTFRCSLLSLIIYLMLIKPMPIFQMTWMKNKLCYSKSLSLCTVSHHSYHCEKLTWTTITIMRWKVKRRVRIVFYSRTTSDSFRVHAPCQIALPHLLACNKVHYHTHSHQ